jgi:hypothetical protein
MTQLWLASRLWNALVEIEHAHEDAKAEIWRSDPACAAAMDALAACDADMQAVAEQARADRSRDRTTVPRQDRSAAHAEAAARRREAKAGLDSARAAAIGSLRPAFTGAKATRNAAVKAQYRQFAQERGLGWGTHNDVVRRRFPLAVKAVERERKAGHPAALRFARFGGTGTLTVQVMHAAGVPPRTVPALNSGQHPRSGVLRVTPWQDPGAEGRRPKGAERHGTLRLTAGRSRAAGPLAVEIPVVLDRWIPAGADVLEVKVTRRRTGSHARLSVAVVCQVPEPEPVTSGPAVAVRLSWKSAGDGFVTVAHAGSPVPLPPAPASLAGVVRVAAGGLSAEILHSAGWRRLLGRDDAIRSVRDENLGAIRDAAAGAMKASPDLCAAIAERRARAWRGQGRDGDPPEVTAALVSRWRSHRRMGWLARDWPQDHPLAGPLEAWRARDRRLQDFEANERAQVLACRKDAWRCAAAWLCQEAGSLVIDAVELPALKEAQDAPGEDPHQARAGRRQMHSAAPGELREAILAAAASRGIPVTEVKRREGAAKERMTA